MRLYFLRSVLFILSLFFASITQALANDFTIKLVENGAAIPGESFDITVSATATNNSHEITGTAFTVDYDTTAFVFNGVSNHFFDNFATQGFFPESVEVGGFNYSEPVVVSASEGKIKIAAAMATSKTIPAGVSTKLFTLHFTVHDNALPIIYPFLLFQTIANNVDAGYLANGEFVPLLIGPVPNQVPPLVGNYTIFDVNLNGCSIVIIPPVDTDGDGLYDQLEITLGLDPDKPDTDGDGIPDGEEVLQYKTNPLLVDSDGDEIPDGDEINIHNTNPLLADSDGDGVNDTFEFSGFMDNHDDEMLNDWIILGNRNWIESENIASPVSGIKAQGYLIKNYPTTADGILQVAIKAHQWNGSKGGVLFRWTDPDNYYFIAVKPGNQSNSSLVFCKNNMNVSKGTVITSNFSIETSFSLTVELSGNTFSFYLDGRPVGSIVDTDHPTGKVGYGYSADWNDYIDFDAISWSQYGALSSDDYDGDGVADASDNSPYIPNPDQEDSDGDGIGNVSDPDADDDFDGIATPDDNCPEISNPDQLDSDGNGTGDACQPTGFLADFEDGSLNNWEIIGNRLWDVIDGSVSAKNGKSETFLMSGFENSNNGTLETNVTVDQWNGDQGGIVFRWTSPDSYYYVAVKPGNQHVNHLVFCVNTINPKNGIILTKELNIGTTFTLTVQMREEIFNIFINGEYIASVQDTSHPYGRIGIAHSDKWNSYLNAHDVSWQDYLQEAD